MTTHEQKPYWALSDDEVSVQLPLSSNESESVIEDEGIKHIWKSRVDYKAQKGLFFKFKNLIGKVCLQTQYFDVCDRHPAKQESKIMQLICPTPGSKLKLHQRHLPVLIYHKSMSIMSPFLYPLPLRSFGTSIHPKCDIIVVPRYDTTFYDLRESNTLDLGNYKSILFRILYTLSVLQKRYGFIHNDQHIQNILMKKSTNNTKIRQYVINGNNYQVPDLDWVPILWDFEDARCDRIHDLDFNAKTNNAADVPPRWCPYYDVHFLLISVIDVFADSNRGIIPSELREWVLKMYPENAIPYRVQTDSQPAIAERRHHRAMYESRMHIEELLKGQTLPETLRNDLHTYLESAFDCDEDDDDIASDDEDWLDEEESDTYYERHYTDGDNYYDYLKSGLPRDGITWDPEVHALGIQARQDMTMTEMECTLDNRLTNTFPDREMLPTVDDLLESDFFQIYRT